MVAAMVLDPVSILEGEKMDDDVDVIADDLTGTTTHPVIADSHV